MIFRWRKKVRPLTDWQVIFSSARVNGGEYHGDYLPAQRKPWPESSWFQARLRLVRRREQVEK